MELTTIKRFVLLDKNPGETWDLITSPEHLEKWYCDSAKVEKKPGGIFEFSGKCIPGEEAKTRFSRFENLENIEFGWSLYGVKTQVHWSLEKQLDMSRLIVTHDAQSTPEVAFTKYCGHESTATENKLCLDDVWWNNWGRLKYYVETGKEPFKPDLSVTPSDAVVQEMTVDVSADKAFSALTEGKHLDGWIGQNANPSLKVGGKFEIGWQKGPQEITELNPGKKIAYSWTYTNEPKTHVEWSVEGNGSSAKIKLVHSGFTGKPFTFNDYNRGWAGFMVRLALYLEKGIPAKDWSGEVN